MSAFSSQDTTHPQTPQMPHHTETSEPVWIRQASEAPSHHSHSSTTGQQRPWHVCSAIKITRPGKAQLSSYVPCYLQTTGCFLAPI